MSDKTILYVVNQPGFFVSHRLALAEAARSEGYAVAVATPEGDGVAAIRAAGFDWYPIRLDHGGRNPLADLKLLVELYSLFRTLRPAIVHNVTIKPVLYGTLAARMAGVPRVINAVSGMGYLFTGGRRWNRALGVMLYRTLMRHRDMSVIVQNREDLTSFIDLKLAPRERIRLIRGSGVDVTKFLPGDAPELPPIVLLTARMLGDKGVREFIFAARELRRKWPNVRFWLVGPTYPGNPSALSEEELLAAQREGAVEWLGQRDDIVALLQRATLYCLPSYREGLPKSLLEAASCALPIVTTDTSGCKEVVTAEMNGLVVPVGDGPALAAAIEALLTDPTRAVKLGQQARRIAVEEFSLEKIVRQHLDLYATGVMHKS